MSKPKTKEEWNKDELLKLYVNKKLNTIQIGKKFNLGKEAIRQRLIKYGIPRRNPSERHKGLKQSELTKEKRSIALQGSKHPFWGKYHSEKTKQKMSISHKGLFSGEKHPNWKGGIKKDGHGYMWIYKPNHRKSMKGYMKRSHLIAEKALGRFLREKEMVHHSNEIRNDDRNENLLICTKSYHAYLHARMKSKWKDIDKRINDEHWLYEKYWVDGLSQRQIAKICRCSKKLVWEKFQEFEIKARDKKEARKFQLIREGFFNDKNQMPTL